MSFEVQAKMLIASGFDDSAGLKAVVPADVTIEEGETVTAFGLSLGVFAELVSTFANEDDITFTFEKGKIGLKSGKAKSSLNLAEGNPLAFESATKIAEMTGEQFRQLLPLTGFTLSDDLNPLSAVCAQFGSLKKANKVIAYKCVAYATNRTSVCRTNFTTPYEGEVDSETAAAPILSPTSYLRKVAKVMSPEDSVTIMVTKDGNKIVVGIKHKSGRKALMSVSSVMSGQYPTDLIENQFSLRPAVNVTLAPSLLSGALARIMAVDSQVAVFIAGKDGKVSVESVDGAAGTARTTLGVQVEGLHTYQNAGTLRSVLEIFGEEVTISFGNGISPSFLSGGPFTAIFSAVNIDEAKKAAVTPEDEESPAEPETEALEAALA